MNHTSAVVPDRSWETYCYQSEGGPVLVSFLVNADQVDRLVYADTVRVIVAIKEPDEHGAPGKTEAPVLYALEDELCERLSQGDIRCLLLGRMTHGGQRELVFQVDGWRGFAAVVAAWAREHGDYAIELARHEGWDFFEHCVWPDEIGWLLIHDRRLVDNLLIHGSDPAKPHALEYVFLGEPDALGAIRQELRHRGYADELANDLDGQLIMTKPLPLDLPTVHAESVANHALAKRHHATCDGWGTTPVS